LRPAVQDAIFPTLAYVAGPGEVTYFSQLRDVYGLLGVSMPAVFPRVSATLVEPEIERAARRFHLSGAGLLSASFEEIAPAPVRRVEEAFAALERNVEEGGRGVRRALDALGGDHGRFSHRISCSLLRSLRRFRKKADRIADERSRAGRMRFRGLRAAGLSGSVPQERFANVVPFLGRYGEGFLDRLSDEIDPLDFCHRIVYVSRLLS
jgi:uncharacterized protein YllA (UPF0747 family)